jgi:hypothetical protein
MNFNRFFLDQCKRGVSALVKSINPALDKLVEAIAANNQRFPLG